MKLPEISRRAEAHSQSENPRQTEKGGSRDTGSNVRLVKEGRADVTDVKDWGQSLATPTRSKPQRFKREPE